MDTWSSGRAVERVAEVEVSGSAEVEVEAVGEAAESGGLVRNGEVQTEPARRLY